MGMTNRHPEVVQCSEEGARSSSSMGTQCPEEGGRLSPKSSSQSSQKPSSIDDDDQCRSDGGVPLDATLVARVAARLSVGGVDSNRLTGYIRTCLSGEDLPTDDATIQRYAAAVRAYTTEKQPSQRRQYPSELLTACEAAGIEPSGPPSALAARLVAEGFLADRNERITDQG